jgi:hypothetical protein
MIDIGGEFRVVVDDLLLAMEGLYSWWSKVVQLVLQEVDGAAP